MFLEESHCLFLFVGGLIGAQRGDSTPPPLPPRAHFRALFLTHPQRSRAYLRRSVGSQVLFAPREQEIFADQGRRGPGHTEIFVRVTCSRPGVGWVLKGTQRKPLPLFGGGCVLAIVVWGLLFFCFCFLFLRATIGFPGEVKVGKQQFQP